MGKGNRADMADRLIQMLITTVAKELTTRVGGVVDFLDWSCSDFNSLPVPLGDAQRAKSDLDSLVVVPENVRV